MWLHLCSSLGGEKTWPVDSCSPVSLDLLLQPVCHILSLESFCPSVLRRPSTA